MKKHITRNTLAALALATATVGVGFAAEDGEEGEQEVAIKIEDAPAAVREAFNREAKGAPLEEVTTDIEGGKRIYEAVATVDGKRIEIEVAADGKLIKIDSDDDDDGEDMDDADEDDEGEVEMKFSDVPEAVQKTLQAHAGGAKIAEVDKENDKGEIVYEADVKIDGQKHEIKVAADGTFLSDKIDDEDDEDDDGGEGDDD